jgi:mannose-6-phosphate isomerase-like protein (cupin superfamily)
VSNLTRVVTGYDASGRPAILWRGQPPTVIHAGRYTTTELWVSDRAPLAAAQADASTREWALEPPPGGACFRIVEIAPDADFADTEAADTDAADDGDASHAEFQGAHATDTLDYVTILRGEVTLVVGDTEVVLRPGDSVVQQPGVPHDWQNRSGQSAVMVGVLLSAS